MRLVVAILCALTCGCTLLFGAEVSADAGPAIDSQNPNADGSDPQRVDADLPDEGGMLGPCTLGTGAVGSVRITVVDSGVPVDVCGPSQTTCGSGVLPPCTCMPGKQCDIPFRVGSRVFMQAASCSFWTASTGNFAGTTFDVMVVDEAVRPLVIVDSYEFCTN